MTIRLRMAIPCLSLAIILLSGSFLAAQQSNQAPPAPVPPQILSAKKIFVANAGGDEPWSDPKFSGDPDRPYNQFYSAIKTLGQYELVSAPADADLLFEIQFSMPPIARKVVNGDSIAGTPDFDPQFRLVIREPKTNALLWAFTEHVPWAILQGKRDKNFDQTVTRVISDVQSLTARSATQAHAKQ